MNNSLRINATSSVGFLVGIGSWSLTFITLILGYFFYRLRVGEWLTIYINEPVFIKALVNTGFLFFSSLMLHQFFNQRKSIFFLFGLGTGIYFIKAQWDLWSLLLAQGLTLRSSMAGSFLYLLTGFHALHVLFGLLILFPFGLQISRSRIHDRAEGRFFFALKFWDLLLLFWCVLFLLIFILK